MVEVASSRQNAPMTMTMTPMIDDSKLNRRSVPRLRVGRQDNVEVQP